LPHPHPVPTRRSSDLRSAFPPETDGARSPMNLWLVLAINSVTLGGLLFLLSAGFSLIFGLMKIPNLTHGSFFMLGAYFAVSLIGVRKSTRLNSSHGSS